LNILITGGAGFIGSHLSELLSANGHNIKIVDNLCSGSIRNISSIINNYNVELIEEDIRNFDVLEKHFKNIDWVFHLAALADVVASIDQPENYFSANVTGTLNVLEASRKNNIKKIIYAASSSCYGMQTKYPTLENAPIDLQFPYALTKYLAEEMIFHWEAVYKIPALSLRLFNVYGPRSNISGTYGAVFGVFLAQKLAGKALTIVGDGEQSRDFVFVSDVANAFKLAAESDYSGFTMNVGTGNPQSINTIVKLLKHDSVNIPKRPGEASKTCADIRLIKDKLGWSPKISFEEGVRIVLENINLWNEAPIWDPDSIAHKTKAWFEYLGKE